MPVGLDEECDCICCGKPKQRGRYCGIPCCLACYENGKLKAWLVAQGYPEDWVLENP